MQNPPHPMWLGESDTDYYLGALTNPGTSAGAEHAPSAEQPAAKPASGKRRRSRSGKKSEGRASS
jgi:NADH-quinone oxidoreductase subunit I